MDVQAIVAFTTPKHVNKGVVDNLDNHLPRGNRANYLLSDRPFLYGSNEILDDGEGDIRLQKRDSNLPHCIKNILLAKRTAPAKFVKDGSQALRQAVKHSSFRILFPALPRVPGYAGGSSC